MNGKEVIMIVHGFGGNSREVQSLADFLQQKGFDTAVPSIDGHDGSRKSLRRSSHKSWLKSIEQCYDSLAQKYDTVSMAGFSMGGLICANLAAKPQAGRIIFINTPVYYWNYKVIFSDIFSSFCTKNYEKLKFYTHSLGKIPLKTGIDFLCLLFKTRPLFAKITRPSFIVQCTRDESVKPKSANYIKNKIGDSATVKFYEGGCHGVLVPDCPLCGTVCNDIYDFLSMADNI